MTPQQYTQIANRELGSLTCEDWLTMFDIPLEYDEDPDRTWRYLQEKVRRNYIARSETDVEFHMLPERFKAMPLKDFLAYCRMRSKLQNIGEVG